MVNCAAYGCKNRVANKRPGITFHRFPSNEQRRKAWVKAVRRKNWEPSKCSYLCSEHFTPEMFDRTSLCIVRLREHAIPTVFKAFPRYLHKVVRKRTTRNSNRNGLLSGGHLAMSTLNRVKQTQKNAIQVKKLYKSVSHCLQQVPSRVYKEAEVTKKFKHGTMLLKRKSIFTDENPLRSGSPSPETCALHPVKPPREAFYELTLKKLKDTVAHYEEKITSLQETKRRYKKDVATLEAIVKFLKTKDLKSDDYQKIVQKAFDFNVNRISKVIVLGHY